MKSLHIYVLSLALGLGACAVDDRNVHEPGNLVPLTVTEDPSLPAASIQGALLHTEAYGPADSTLVICIHGGPGSDYRYMLRCKDLANHGYRVVFYDQRGSGLSQRFPMSFYESEGDAGLESVYDELSGIITHYRTRPEQKVFLLGHSWGGMLATGYCGRYPQAVQGLVVAEPGGFAWDDIVTYVRNSQAFSLWGEMLNDANWADQFMNAGKDDHEVLDYRILLLSVANDITGEYNVDSGGIWRPGAVVNTALFNLGERTHPDFSTGLSRFTVPTLFLYSDRNQAYPTEWAQRISAPFPQVELVQVKNTGHSGMLTDAAIWQQQTLPRILQYFSTR